MRISIITVAYNSAATIRDTIESVLAQTYPDIEYIVVDGVSKDNTVAITEEYKVRFKGRLQCISEPDLGMYDAMNKGIRFATGDVVGIINSDDFYHETDTIAKIAMAFKDKSVRATIGDIRFVQPDNLGKTVRYYSAKNFTPLRFRFGFMPPHPSFFTYRENFETYGYYQTDYHIAADYELLIRFLYTNRLNYRYLPLVVMKMRTGGRSNVTLKSNLVLNQEIVRGCRENGIYTNLFILMLKYFVKVSELIFTRHGKM